MREQEKIKVEVTIGPATVRIEAPPEKVEEAVKQVISALKASLPQLKIEEKTVARELKGKSLPTCSILLKNLIDEGWFDKPRTLAETVQELARRGYNYDSTAVSHSLLDLVRERTLTREGSPRRYVYYRTQPAVGAALEVKPSE
jgi:acetolactate synthase small subunit